ncbi:hypothetical protein [Pseudanabaena mucicola]|uniref:Uncharacterized protein n=1 Tax=Pseudanabaena mucicola FACHB-723 TaxID=2692860 RepID=A0ABR8A079_9CYAN|nr:hypothetical protein [Pseudanabaena mucicola]MBD2189185.1 hypothetical protein [Pseudanabaena mucicola FACHB-723]
MTLFTLNNSKINDLNSIVSQWNGKLILKTNVTKISLDKFGDISSIEDETIYQPDSQAAFPSSEPFHIDSPKIDSNSFTYYNTDKSKTESEQISGLWLDPQGDFMITSPQPLKVEVDDAPYSGVSKTHLVHSSGMLVFRSEKIDLKGINQKLP